MSPEDEKNGRGYYKPGDLPFLHVDKYYRGIVGQLSDIPAVADVRSNEAGYYPPTNSAEGIEVKMITCHHSL